MPRKAKEKVDEIEEKDKKKSVVKKTASKKADVSKKKTESAKKVSTKKADTKAKASTDKTKAKKTVSKKSALAKEGIDDEPKAKKKAASKSTAKSLKKEPAAKSTVKGATKKAETQTAKKITSKKTETKSSSKSTAKKSDTKAATKSTTKKADTKPTTKSSDKKATSKATAKSTAKKSTTKSTTKKSPTKKSKEPIQILEYYDLPYKYGNTVVRLLAQTPKTLFVYWEVSDSDIANFKKVYGEDFYNKTKPILIVHNLTLNKTYEVEINDFANCWYLNTDDTDCKFDIELARKFITNFESQNDYAEYLYVAQSNNLQSPNDHILFEKLKEFVIFKDVSTNKKIKKDIKSFKFLKDIYKFYKDMYDEDILNNPSSQFKF